MLWQLWAARQIRIALMGCAVLGWVGYAMYWVLAHLASLPCPR